MNRHRCRLELVVANCNRNQAWCSGRRIYPAGAYVLRDLHDCQEGKCDSDGECCYCYLGTVLHNSEIPCTHRANIKGLERVPGSRGRRVLNY